MNLFDIIGPVMVGPSSSHTAGVVRIGNVVHSILGGVPDKVVVKFHGSFAKTYEGHGSNKAIIAGVMGYKPDDERIRTSLPIAKELGLEFSFETINIPNAHPNTVLIEAESLALGTLSIQGESIGGGCMVIRKINDISVEFDGQYDTLIVSHTDKRGVIAFVCNVLSHEEINIARMLVYRSEKGGDAIMLIEADGSLDKNIVLSLSHSKNIKKATVVSKLM